MTSAPITVAAFLTTQHSAGAQMTAHGEAAFWRSLGADYARKFFAGVRRHQQQPTRCVLVTDTPDAVPHDYGVEYVALRHRWPGWWSKLNLFEPGVLSGKVFYSDLDNVIAGDLSALFDLEPSPLIMLDDVIFPGLPNGAAMLFDADAFSFANIWRDFCADAWAIIAAYTDWPHAADQAFLADQLRALGRDIVLAQTRVPRGYILNARAELEAGADTSRCHLVYGSYIPKPHDSLHAFYREHWRALSPDEWQRCFVRT